MHSEDNSAADSQIEALLDRYLEALRQGKRVTIAEYTERYPDLADEIRELFPIVAAMEGWKEEEVAAQGGTQSLGGVPLHRLGDFRIIREIGRGGMGIVYEAIQESLQRTVAVKVLPPTVGTSDRALRRFRREAQTAAALHHPHIVPVFGFGTDNGFNYIAMQLIDGCGLDHVLRRKRCSDHARSTDAEGNAETRAFPTIGQSPRSASGATDTNELDFAPQPNLQLEESGGLEARLVARLGIQACEALQYAHESDTLHRDIKPANMLLDRAGRLWLADFGLARAVEQETIGKSGDIVGTLLYMPPERLKGVSDARSDIYSLGVSLAELLLGHPLFESKQTGSLVELISRGIVPKRGALGSSIPHDLETILLKSVAVDPSDRYDDVATMAGDLRAFLDDRPVQARRASRFELTWRWCRRNPVVTGLATTVALLLVLTVVITSVGYWQQQKMRVRTEDMLDITVAALDKIYARYATPLGSLNDPLASNAVINDEAIELLQELLPVYDQLASQGGDTGDLQRESVKAKLRVAEIALRLGNPVGAQTRFREAIDGLASLDMRNASDEFFWRQAEGNAWLGLGVALEWQGESELAVENKQRALRVLERASASSPTEVNDLALARARAHFLLGRRVPSLMENPSLSFRPVVRTGPPERRRSLAQNGPGRRGNVPGSGSGLGPGSVGPGFLPPGPGGAPGGPAAHPPPNPLAPRTWQNAGLNLYVDVEESKTAQQQRKEHLLAAIELLDNVKGSVAHEHKAAFLRAKCMQALASLPIVTASQSSQWISEAVGTLTRLEEEFPDSQAYEYELARTLMKQAELSSMGRSAEDYGPLDREGDLQQAVNLLEELRFAQPLLPDYAAQLARAYETLAWSLKFEPVRSEVETGKTRGREADRLMEKAVGLQQSLMERFPESLAQQWWLLRFRISQLHIAMGGPTQEERFSQLPDVQEAFEALVRSQSEDDWTVKRLAPLFREQLEQIEQQRDRLPQDPQNPRPPMHRPGPPHRRFGF